jgi:hypothetical protein
MVSLVERLIYNHGEREAISRLKLLRLQCQQFISGQSISLQPFQKVDKDMFPKAIKFLKPNLTSLNDMRYSLSIMRVIELFKGKTDKDTSTITDESTASPKTLHDIEKFISKCKWLKHIKPVDTGYLPMSNRAGPNGPASIAALADLTALRREENQNLLEAIKEQLKVTISWLNIDAHEEIEGEWQHSKLVFLADRACKTRVIAIADWWSNAALSNIHRTFMQALAKVKNDLTFRQDSIPKHLISLGPNLFSSDMTAFTDRFPRRLEKAVVAAVHGASMAQRWETIISDRRFNTGYGDPVKYEVGNPMGVLSSWPVSTATHHVIKLYVCYKLNIKKYKYGLLGDDSVDSNKKVFGLYQKTLRKLGVNISMSKCTTSSDGSGEFAKRIIRRRNEVTGLPVYLLQHLDKNPEQMLELVKMCRQRGYTDVKLGPAVKQLVETLPKKVKLPLLDLLSLPERITGQAPLLEVPFGGYADKLLHLTESDQTAYLLHARDLVFWSEVKKLSLVTTKKEPTSRNTQEETEGNNVDDKSRLTVFERFKVKANHPLVFALNNQLEPYLGLEPFDEADFLSGDSDFDFSEYTVYDSWIKGDYRYLAKLPSLDTYKYYSKGHKATKCKFLVLKKMLELVITDDTHLFLRPIDRISDEDLYEKAFSDIKSNFMT